MNTQRIFPLALILAALCIACGGSPVLTVEMPLHLEDHLNAATITGSEIPVSLPTVEWRFDQTQEEWKATPEWNPPYSAPTLARTVEGQRVSLTERNRLGSGVLRGGIHVNVPDWVRDDWAEVIVRARADSTSAVNNMRLGFNLRDGRGGASDQVQHPFRYPGGAQSPIVRDGAVHIYRLRVAEAAPAFRSGPWRQLGIMFTTAGEPGSIELLSVSVTPAGAEYNDATHGVRDLDREGVLRPALFTHAPSRMHWRVRVPDAGRLGVALAIHTPLTFSVNVSTSAARDTSVFREVVTDGTKWHERTIDLSAFAGQTIDLSLQAESNRAGQIGFWGTPILSGTPRTTGKRSLPPNVIVYVIDGGGADLMSLYGYNRHTTPNLERLAAEAVVFDRAHSNSAWTKPSTASFMTGLQHSALGGYSGFGDLIPKTAPTMGERFHAAGYQTAVFTFHPNAGRGSDLNRGVDRFQDRARPGQTRNESSRFLSAEFWDWRKAFPGSPYWAHFQVTDVHQPLIPVPPFAGMFREAGALSWYSRETPGGSPPESGQADRGEMSLAAAHREGLARLGIDRIEYYNTQRGLYDESMAHVDHQIGQFVERLKATGEWDNTILIVTADHGHPAGSYTRFGRELFDPVPPDTEGAFFDSYRTRVPLMIFAPGRLPAGIRIRETVSLVDLLPTVLDLAGLAPLERTQGRSLVPLMRGDPNWEKRPVILEQLERDVNTNEFTGHIEMIDGQWGASLEIWPVRKPGEPPVQPARWEAKARLHVDGQPRLLLYDLWDDPFVRQNVNSRYPDLVTKYTTLLEKQWAAHLAMAALYKPGGQVQLSPEQIATLRALGYIR